MVPPVTFIYKRFFETNIQAESQVKLAFSFNNFGCNQLNVLSTAFVHNLGVRISSVYLALLFKIRFVN